MKNNSIKEKKIIKVNKLNSLTDCFELRKYTYKEIKKAEGKGYGEAIADIKAIGLRQVEKDYNSIFKKIRRLNEKAK